MALPDHMRADVPHAADPARRRLLHKSRFPRFPSLPALPSPSPPSPPPSPPLPPLAPDDIHIDHVPLLAHNDKDIYRWAVVYENQRGITLFSTPFYSPHSLFPSDPQPFTLPDTSQPLPNLSLDNYPLPDGLWRWVSTAWMIDMRSSLGEVQPDGFEYNWRFRHDNWRAKAGFTAWVRRRRWVRLMVRPADRPLAHDLPSLTLSPYSSAPSLLPPPSTPSLLDSFLRTPHLWDGSDHDWKYLRHLLKLLGRDGRKLELWRSWLSPHDHDPKGKCKLPNPSSQDLLHLGADTNPPPLPHLVSILRNHGEDVLRSFVFPDSRTQFLHLLSLAGLAEHLEHALGRSLSVFDVDFWSYTNVLDKSN